MRILSLSDIHGNIAAVARMRARQANDFDLLIVAGDIGHSGADAIFDILDTFGCPIAYIYGNHDYSAEYGVRLGENGHHLHENPLIIDRVRIHGFSGCPTAWGLNPIARKLTSEFELANASIIHAIEDAKSSGAKAVARLERSREFKTYSLASAENYDRILYDNRASIICEMKELSEENDMSIVVTHERLTEAWRDLSNVNCFIHGHIHRFSDTSHKGARFLNVAAIDKPISVRPTHKAKWGFNDLRRVNTGNYVTFEVNDGAIQNVQCKRFGWDSDNWTEHRERMVYGASYVGEDSSRDT
jgi:predicted phosphodiesterase